MEVIAELWNWLQTLEPSFAFLVALPFVVGAIGLAGCFATGARRDAVPRTRVERSRRPAHVQ